jgi:hypothetical protein
MLAWAALYLVKIGLYYLGKERFCLIALQQIVSNSGGLMIKRRKFGPWLIFIKV